MDAESYRIADGPFNLDAVRVAVQAGDGPMIPIIGAFLRDEAWDGSIELCYYRFQRRTWRGAPLWAVHG